MHVSHFQIPKVITKIVFWLIYIYHKHLKYICRNSLKIFCSLKRKAVSQKVFPSCASTCWNNSMYVQIKLFKHLIVIEMGIILWIWNPPLGRMSFLGGCKCDLMCQGL